MLADQIPQPCRFLWLTDSHLYARNTSPDGRGDCGSAEQFFEQMVREGLREGADFVLHTGDFCNGNIGVEGHRRFKKLIDRLAREHGVPFHLVRGNHDAIIPDAEYFSVYGEGTCLHRHKGWAFLCVDRYFRTYQHTQHAFAMSAETIDRCRTLLADLDPATPLIVALHDDPVGVSRFHRGLELMHLLERHNVRSLLFGHVQANYTGGFRGIPFFTCVGDDRPHDSSPLTIAVVDCIGAEVRCSLRPVTVNVPAIETDLPESRATVCIDGDWADVRGPSRTRAAAGGVCETTRPTLGWRQKVGGGFGPSGLVLAGGRLLVAGFGWGNPADRILAALDPVGGEILWQHSLDGDSLGGPVVHGDTVYCGTSAGSLLACDAETGAVRWRWNNRDNMPIGCQPLVADGLVHCASNWEMYAVDASTGVTRWRSIATSDGFTYMGPGNAAPLVVGDRVFHVRPFNATERGTSQIQSVLAATGRDLQCVDPHPQMHPRFRHATPVFHRGKLYGVANGLVEVDLADPDGGLRFFQHSEGSAGPACREDLVVVSYHDEIVCYEGGGGSVRWRVPQLPARWHFGGASYSKYGFESPLGAFAMPLILNRSVVSADCGGRLRCFAIESGAGLWSITLPAPLLCSPIFSGNTLFAGDCEGNVAALVFTEQSG